jgi:two-component system CheB/CheR fusion protein
LAHVTEVPDTDAETLAADEASQSSKDALQLLTRELATLNARLQETLALRTVPTDDVQNALSKTDIAMLFVDADLTIRFFTAGMNALPFARPGEGTRSLADLDWSVEGGTLVADALEVLDRLQPVEREIEMPDGACYLRRISPYRSQDDTVGGAVILFLDITAQKRSERALLAAKEQADLANVAKARFLAAANHDLRQPLQALVLLQGGLAETVEGERPRKMVARLGETLAVMSGMLSTLLGINQIEPGAVQADKIRFPIRELLDQIRSEFTYQARSRGLELLVLPCSLSVHSDPRLLNQMVRNLLANAIKYTKRGRVLVGCRRRAGVLSVEIWDTGAGLPADVFQAALEEEPKPGRGGIQGLGLGLSIVQWLGSVLGHRVRVHSKPDKGSVFSIEVALAAEDTGARHEPPLLARERTAGGDVRRTGAILIVEDDPEVRELLEFFLQDEGHRTATALDGSAALELVERDALQPDLLLVDYNLPNGVSGFGLAQQLRESLGRDLPVIVLTGALPTEGPRDATLPNCVTFGKPLKLPALSQVIQYLLPTSLATVPATAAAPAEQPLPAEEASRTPSARAGRAEPSIIFVVDDDSYIRDAIRAVLEEDGQIVEGYPDCESFLAAYQPGREACLLLDAYLPGMSGLSLLQRLNESDQLLPSIMITGNSDVPMAVQAMKAGALDFIEKPVTRAELLACVGRALEQSRDSSKMSAQREAAANQVAGLSPRQRQIMELVLAGQSSKIIAWNLGIAQRTVEAHRAWIMKKTGAKSLPQLARVAFAANWKGPAASGAEPPV